MKLTLVFFFSTLALLLAIIFLLRANYTAPAKKDVLSVNDGPLGLSFNVPASFTAITGAELKSKSPFFLYGYNPADVKEAECFVSQTTNSKEGNVSVQYLHEGLLAQLNKSYSSVEEEGWQDISLGGTLVGVKVAIKYKNGESSYKLLEVATSSPKKTTFASCTAPYSLYKVYEKDFEIFLGSLKVSSDL